jgi:hypothetical protein
VNGRLSVISAFPSAAWCQDIVITQSKIRVRCPPFPFRFVNPEFKAKFLALCAFADAYAQAQCSLAIMNVRCEQSHASEQHSPHVCRQTPMRTVPS